MKLPNNPKVFGFTLGCRLNSFETEALVEELINKLAGTRVEAVENADIAVVNTCAVTSRSQARSRKTVRSYLAKFPDIKIVVTGCVATVSPRDFSDLHDDRVSVFSNTTKNSIASIIAEQKYIPLTEGLFPVSVPIITSKTRAFLKIQDGCNNLCTYCIVPIARGKSKSQPKEIVLQQARELVKAGYKEISLTGVDIADYGTDLYKNGYELPELVEDLLSIGGFRLRIGSIEPQYFTVKKLEKLAIPGVCSHFHIPFQSGSNRILKMMGRKYLLEEEHQLLDAVKELFPNVCVGSDILVGFPGETESDFEQTLDFVTSGKIHYLHVFPFSPRPGTPAAKLKPLHTEYITTRAEKLRQISIETRKRFRESNINKSFSILVESRTINGNMIGLTDNYIPVFAPAYANAGELVKVKLNHENICWRQR